MLHAHSSVARLAIFILIIILGVNVSKGDIARPSGISVLSDSLDADMPDLSFVLNEVVVKKKKEKYSKKNNPAVDLIRKVREDNKKTDPSKMPFYNYDLYEKTLLAGEDFNMDFNKGGKLKKQFDFLSQYLDTALWTGKPILDLSLTEKASTIIHSGGGKSKKEFVVGIQSNGINEIMSEENFRTMIEDVMREIDIRDNDINLLQNRFVSPLAQIGPDFYKYEITDTLPIGEEQCVEITFTPKTPETFGFNGKLFIPVGDSLRYVKRVTMRVPKAINVNYLDNIFVSQNFEMDSLGKVHKVLDDLSMELKILKVIPSVYGSRQTRYSNFSYDTREEYNGLEETLSNRILLTGAVSRGEDFWEERRLIPLSRAEDNLTNLMTGLRNNKIFYWGEKIGRVLVQGYVGTLPKGSKFNLGPVNTFVSFNDVEGVRLKVGGLTTSHLSDHFFMRGYVAYGTKDHRWKFDFEPEYSFFKKKNHSREFPMNSIRATIKYDTEQIGVKYLYANPDNIIFAIKRRKNDLFTYLRLIQLEYDLELANNLSFNVGYRNENRESTRWIDFRDGYERLHSSFTLGAFFAKIRFAPGEKFIQGTSKRAPVNLDAPIFTLSHEYGPKNLFGADFVMNRSEFSFMKRFWFSAFGYTNVLLKAGKIWSQVPYAALFWQNSNLSYTIQPESFALLNPMEFAMDQYISWDMEYFMNGAIFNRIPLIKKLKLREVLSFKGFLGSLTDKNNPAYHPNLYLFPKDSYTQPMGKTPYMEISAGIDNILTVLRVDYVWRLTYRHLPGIDRGGVRVALHLSF
ncbi:MAG: carboxypeptidase-like regulatory domain-containing protein [Bacteroidales bacterium]|nr:carboxypeptidase-like regulatory domain-containing protein [Bacteroidales bacterium]